jgi:hypothetical protein
VVHWADGGGTELDNLVLLCRRHHRAVHEGGFRVEVAGRGEVQFFRPGGARMEQAPVAPTLASNSVERLRGGNPNGIGPWTPTPDWYGERLDLDWAIYSLRGFDLTPRGPT